MEANNFPSAAGPPIAVVFGNGQSSIARDHATVGQLPAIVCDDRDLKEDLISVNPLLDAGFKLTMEADFGILVNESTQQTIHVRREGPRWSIDLQDLAKATSAQPQLETHPAIADMVQANAVLYAEPTSIRDKVISLHERMGHAHAEAMCDAISGDSPAWIHCDLTPAQIRKVMRRHRCLICHLTKRQRPPITPPSGDRRDMPPGWCISGDIVPVSPPAHDGSTMFFLFADVRTGYMMVYTGKAKDAFLEAFKSAVSHLRKWGHEVKAFRSDAETVLKDGRMGQYLHENGFTHELSTPEAHYQNFVERYVQTINRFTSALLHGQDILQSKHWDWALFHTVDCRNRVPNVKCAPSTPYEMITGNKVNLQKTFQFTFGDLVAVHMPKEKRNWKFDLRWDIGVYVGQPEHSVEAAVVYFPYRNALLVRTDVAKLEITEEAYKRFYFKRYDVSGSSISTATRIHHRVEECLCDFDKAPEEDVNDSSPEPMNTPLIEPEETPPELQPEARTRQRRRWDDLPPARVTRSHTRAANLCSLSDDELTEVFCATAVKVFLARAGGPKVHEALESGIREQWIDAMFDEIVDGMMNTSRTLEPEDIDKSKPYKLIHTTMQLKVKMKTDTIVDKLKARLCACGNELTEVDHETYSPTVSSLTHSLMLQIAVHDRMNIQLIDTKAAYLCQDYPQDSTPLYVVLPRRVAMVLGLNPDQTYRVKKYIYGLPDAGRAYYDAYSAHLIENDFKRSVSDPCLFFKVNGPTRRVYVWIHVDDTLIAADRIEDIEDFKRVMTKRFEITVNTEADHHLGVNMTAQGDGSLKLTQSKLLKTIFTEFKDALPKTNNRHRVPLNPNRTSAESDPFDRKQYLHLLGMLNYLLRSRPDIATAISFAATKSTSPTYNDYHSLLDIVKYLWQTKDIGLIIHPGKKHEPLRLKCFVDASFLSHDDSRGHTGYCITIGDIGTFYSKSVKQQLVATSSTHAEVKALYQLVVDLIYIINLCDEIGRAVDLPVIIFEDNNPTVQLSGSLSARVKRSKHFLMLVNFIRQNVVLGLIEVLKVASEDNVADVLTKPLAWRDFYPKACRLLGISEDNDPRDSAVDTNA